MLSRLITVLRKDVKTATRDGLALYLLASPFLFALLVRLSLPVAEGLPITFAVGPGLSPSLVAALDEQATLEALPTRAAVGERVLARDDVPGLVAREDGRVEVLLQGDEAPWLQALPGTLVDLEAHRASGAPLPALEVRSLGERRPLVRAMAAAMLGFSVLLVVGLVAGMAVLEERETGVARLVAVSPLRFLEYALAKLALAVGLGLALAAIALFLVVGADAPWPALALALVASAPIGASLGLLVGAFAKDQLAAIAMLKAFLFFYTTVPVAGFVVDGPWAMALWPLPNHWAVQSLFQALVGKPDVVALGLAFGLGTLVLAPALVVLRRRVGLAA